MFEKSKIQESWRKQRLKNNKFQNDCIEMTTIYDINHGVKHHGLKTCGCEKNRK